jgi:hypothetical protein
MSTISRVVADTTIKSMGRRADKAGAKQAVKAMGRDALQLGSKAAPSFGSIFRELKKKIAEDGAFSGSALLGQVKKAHEAAANTTEALKLANFMADQANVNSFQLAPMVEAFKGAAGKIGTVEDGKAVVMAIRDAKGKLFTRLSPAKLNLMLTDALEATFKVGSTDLDKQANEIARWLPPSPFGGVPRPSFKNGTMPLEAKVKALVKYLADVMS